jgi:oligoribonuclease
VPSKDFILFLDLECTGAGGEGLIPNADEHLLEIGLVMTDHTPYLNEVARKNIILPIWPEEVAALDPVVFEMHTKNSLLTDCKALAEGLTPEDRPGILREVDLMLAGWMKQFSKKTHIKLAGSGVLHFDRKFIKRDLRFFDSTLTHYALDIGSTRRQLEIAGIELPDARFGFKTHRAVEDAAMHAQEMRDFFRWARKR